MKRNTTLELVRQNKFLADKLAIAEDTIEKQDLVNNRNMTELNTFRELLEKESRSNIEYCGKLFKELCDRDDLNEAYKSIKQLALRHKFVWHFLDIVIFSTIAFMIGCLV